MVARLREGDSITVFASKAGAPTNPDWYHNLRAHPQITVEYGTESFTANVTELSESQSQTQLAKQATLIPTFNDYVASAAPRVIPAFSVERV